MIHVYVLKYVRSFVRLFGCSSVCSFACSFVCLFICSFVCLFVRLSVHQNDLGVGKQVVFSDCFFRYLISKGKGDHTRGAILAL